MTLPGGDRAVSISAFHAGPLEEAERALQSLRAALTPIEDRIVSSPTLSSSARRRHLSARRPLLLEGAILANIPDAAIDALLDLYLAAPSSRSLFVFQQVGGAIAPAGRAIGIRKS